MNFTPGIASTSQTDATPVHTEPESNDFTLFNINGLAPQTKPSKIPFIRDILACNSHLFLGLTETWLEHHNDAEVSIESYTLFRQDRPTRKNKKGRHVGGVSLYVLESWAPDADTLLKYSNKAVDILGVHIPSRNIFISVIYRQPDDKAHGNPSSNNEFVEVLNKLKDTITELPSPTPDIIIMGDFNFPHMLPDTWKNGQTRQGIPKDENAMINSMQRVVDEFFLEQLIDTATHQDGNILDLIFTNNADLLHSFSCDETIFSDHHLVHCKSNYIYKQTTEQKSASTENDSFGNLNFFSDDVNWEKISQELSDCHWEQELSHCDNHSTMMDKFIELCFKVCQKFVPKKKSRIPNSKIKIPRYRRNLMRRRTKIKKKIKQKRLSAKRRTKLKHELIEIEVSLKSDYCKEKATQEDHAISAIRKNSKHFFSYAKKFSKVRQGIGPLSGPNSESINCPKQMADILSNQYASVWTIPSINKPDITNANTSNPSLSDIEFTPHDLEKAIDELSNNSSPGPDKFPALLLKRCKESLSYPLFLIWRESLDTSEINSKQKSAHVIPIHKGGSKAPPKNYRPIALTSHLINIFEKVVRNALVSYIEKHDLFNATQHGFRFGRSCLSQLLDHYDKITKLMEEGHDVDVVYVDFAKAFDKVDINIAMAKIRALGISGRLADWIYCFLIHRTQQVVVNSAKSSAKEVISGVPQGSVLGPLIFLILIGDIDKEIATAFLSSFADDTRIGREVDCETDAESLQSDLNTVYNWCIDNNMSFNSDKFEYMSYLSNTNNAEFHKSEYYDNNGNSIKRSDHVKDLGVQMSSCGTFTHHINHTTTKAKQLCGWILRTFVTRDTLPMMTLYKSLVLPHFDYCSQLWSPSSPGEINKLEIIQRAFIKKIYNVHKLSYWQQLQYFKLFSLQRRRERYRIIYLWKMMEKMVPQVGELKVINHDRIGRYCYVPRVKSSATARVKSIRYSSFSIHAPQLFNSLPYHIRNLSCCSIDIFKKRLDEYLHSIPDEPQITGYTACRRAKTNSIIHMRNVAQRDLGS